MNPEWWKRIKTEAKQETSGIIPVEGGIAIKSKYNKDFVAAIKRIPKEYRSWNDTPNNKFWFVAESHAGEAIALYDQFFGKPEVMGGFPVSLAEINQDDPSTRFAIRAEMQYRPVRCPDCRREMEQDGGYPYCEWCDG